MTVASVPYTCGSTNPIILFTVTLPLVGGVHERRLVVKRTAEARTEKVEICPHAGERGDFEKSDQEPKLG
jgi:hypothetical protein